MKEKTKVAISKRYATELAYRKHDIINEYDLGIFLKGYIEGVKAMVEPLGMEVKIIE